VLQLFLRQLDQVYALLKHFRFITPGNGVHSGAFFVLFRLSQEWAEHCGSVEGGKPRWQKPSPSPAPHLY